MHVSQIVRNSADVLTITHLSPGDVYKRIEDSSYADASLRFGIVQSVMNNGDDAAVTALEFAHDYNGAAPAMKVFNGNKPAAIFPATPDEVLVHMTDVRNAAKAALQRAADAHTKAAAQLDAVEAAFARIDALSAPATSTTVLEAPPSGDDE